jgi:hypothetical protein
MTTRGDLLTMSSTPTVTRLGIGTSSYALTSNGTDPIWGQIAAGGIASDAVTTAKIINSAVTTDKIADSAVTSAKIADATIVQGDIALTLLKLLCPVGSIKAYAGAAAPTGWILCDGTAVVSGTHPELYALCATTPDLRGRFALGKAASGTGSTLLGTGGSTTITEANLPSHTHANTLTNNAVTSGSGSPHQHANVLTYTGGTVFAEHPHTHTMTNNYTSTYTNGNGNYYTEGNTIASQSIQTGNNSASTSIGLSNANESAHTHSVTSNVTITNGAIGSGTDYYQPFVAVNYIIKHDYV